MYGCESWTIKKAECRRIDAFELWCWRRLLESPLDCREIQPVHPKGDQSWVFIGRTDVEAETPIVWPPGAKSWLLIRPWYWERLRVGGEGDNGGWDGWMASLTWWTWVWVNSGSWWWTGRPGVLWFMGSERVGHDWETELTGWKVLFVWLSHGLSFLLLKDVLIASSFGQLLWTFACRTFCRNKISNHQPWC